MAEPIAPPMAPPMAPPIALPTVLPTEPAEGEAGVCWDAPPAAVLLLGESGTGKEMAAQAIHDNAPGQLAPLLPLIAPA